MVAANSISLTAFDARKSLIFIGQLLPLRLHPRRAGRKSPLCRAVIPHEISRPPEARYGGLAPVEAYERSPVASPRFLLGLVPLSASGSFGAVLRRYLSSGRQI